MSHFTTTTVRFTGYSYMTCTLMLRKIRHLTLTTLKYTFNIPFAGSGTPDARIGANGTNRVLLFRCRRRPSRRRHGPGSGRAGAAKAVEHSSYEPAGIAG